MPGCQLRVYTLAEGATDAFLDVFWNHLVPLRTRWGFRVEGGPWLDRAARRLVWVVAYDGPEPIEEVDAAYYASPERAEAAALVKPLLEAVVETRFLEPAARPAAGRV